MSRLAGKVSIITGAGAGIGRAMALRFADEGASVIAIDVSGGEQDTARERPTRITPIRADVASENEFAGAIRVTINMFGGLDNLCNVAGIGQPSALQDVTMEGYDRVLDVNLRAVVIGMKHAVPALARRGGGTIINISSLAGLNGTDYGAATYSAAKAGVIGVTKVAAVEGGRHNVRVNAICPGIITSPLGVGALAKDGGAMARKPCLERAGKPEEVAAVAAFLASDDASYVSGAVIPVDGGWSARLA